MSLKTLTCPSCKTTFRIDAEAVGSDGRMVRCAACKHQWMANRLDLRDIDDSEQSETVLAPATLQDAGQSAVNHSKEASMKDAFAALMGDPPSVEDEIGSEDDATADDGSTFTFVDKKTGDDTDITELREDTAFAPVIEESSETTSPPDDLPDLDTLFPEIKPRTSPQDGILARYHARAKLLMVANVVMLCVIGISALLMYRDAIIQAVPLAEPAYNIIGFHPTNRMKLADVLFSRNDVKDESHYKVKGSIINHATSAAPAPTIRVRLLDADKDIIKEWESAEKETIASAQQKVFSAQKLRSNSPNAATLSLEIGSPLELMLQR